MRDGNWTAVLVISAIVTSVINHIVVNLVNVCVCVVGGMSIFFI